jgi:hypothetical protein
MADQHILLHDGNLPEWAGQQQQQKLRLPFMMLQI